jgi:hypothetical protein
VKKIAVTARQCKEHSKIRNTQEALSGYVDVINMATKRLKNDDGDDSQHN